MSNTSTKKIAFSALCVALIIVGTFLKIPLPLIPITLQVGVVIFTGMLMGKTWGLISTLAYTFLGLVGVPIFTAGGGLAYVLNPTFGYIIGFNIAVFVVGFLTEKLKDKSFLKVFLISVVGILIIYLAGMIYFYLLSHLYLGKDVTVKFVLVYCGLVFLPGDLISCLVCCLVYMKVRKHIKINF